MNFITGLPSRGHPIFYIKQIPTMSHEEGQTWSYRCDGGHPAPPKINKLLEGARLNGLWPASQPGQWECQACTDNLGYRQQHRQGGYVRVEVPAFVCPEGHPAPKAFDRAHAETLPQPPQAGRFRCYKCNWKYPACKFTPASARAQASLEANLRRTTVKGGRPAGGRAVLNDTALSAHFPQYLRDKKGYSPADVTRRLAAGHYEAPHAAQNRLDWVDYIKLLVRLGYTVKANVKLSRLRHHRERWRSLAGHEPQEVQDMVWGWQKNKCCGTKCRGAARKLVQGVSETHHMVWKCTPARGGHCGPNEPWNLQGRCRACHVDEHQ